jgi:hypothetical protein
MILLSCVRSKIKKIGQYRQQNLILNTLYTEWRTFLLMKFNFKKSIIGSVMMGHNESLILNAAFLVRKKKIMLNLKS